ncbi:hypothetical protein FOIG_05617 [Fusarium odoratissimum NRRL 54006]|uniref:Uncharacterized protein n=2 Tax=Fusarium oxysporum species complex TaxID=171631 RepID=X0JRZ2_FUSO5|nr:uncharacterized protein FOIG_05617 [Fusarium odoratissimum NRRL 54006]EXM04049.1 hypothetical protein FOIG_05617 [Fusarium odoratissimum NRRL 54006]TXC10507.1 hypothetical protein FocTR4_00005588 [Fusarium oxysporum f. sp. cubense]
MKKMTSNYSPTIHFSLVYCVSTRAPLGRAGAGVHIQTVMQANEWTSVATSSYIQTMIHVTSQTTSIITATKESYNTFPHHDRYSPLYHDRIMSPSFLFPLRVSL